MILRVRSAGEACYVGRMVRALPSLLLLSACGRAEVEVYIAPFDGQTQVALDTAPVVHGGAQEVPPDYPVGELVRVVDLDAGGFVPGHTVADGQDLRFVLDTGFTAGRRYGWVIDPMLGVPHGPDLTLPDGASGTAVFSTSDDVVPVAVANDDDLLCVFLSAPVGSISPASARIEANDVFVEVTAATLLDAQDYAFDGLADADVGAGVACFQTVPLIGVGATVRVWWGAGDPIRLQVAGDPLPDVLATLYRGRE